MTMALQARAFDRERAARVAAVAGACLLAGTVAALRPSAAPLIVAAAVFAIICAEWRRGVWALVVLMPFAGVPVFLAGEAGQAFRDGAVVLPLYVAFVVAHARAGHRIALPPIGIGAPALAVFAVLVVLGVARAPSVSVGVIGARVWLAYVPLLVVGYHFACRSDDADRALALTARLGLVPAALAIVEWVIASRTGGFGPFARLYGAGATPSVLRFGYAQDFALIARVPSTFTSATGYFGFSIVAYAAALAQALRHGGRGWAACCVALAAGAAASGTRSAYVMVPAITAGGLLLAGVRPSRLAAAAAVVAMMALALVAGGVDPLLVARLLPDHVGVTLSHAWREMRSSLTAFGHGTGWDTNAALRYGGAPQARFVENWFAKASLELGVLGLASVTLAIAAIVAAMLRPLRGLDAKSRQLAAPVVALLALTTASLFKAPFIDLDPLNVYFWLLAGMVLGLAHAARAGAGVTSPVAEAEE